MGRGPSRAIRSARVSPSMNSIAMNGVRGGTMPPGASDLPSAVSPTSYTVQMLGWFRAAAVRASRSSRARNSSSGATSAGRNFSATMRRSSRSSARYTTPMPPAPHASTTRYRPKVAPIIWIEGAGTRASPLGERGERRARVAGTSGGRCGEYHPALTRNPACPMNSAGCADGRDALTGAARACADMPRRLAAKHTTATPRIAATSLLTPGGPRARCREVQEGGLMVTRASAAGRRDEVVDLLLQFLAGGYGAGDLLAQQVAAAPPQPMHGNLDGALRHARRRRRVRVARRLCAGGQIGPQVFEQSFLTSGLALGAETFER